VTVHSFGMFLGPIFGGLVVDRIGIGGAFQAGAALSLLGVLGFWDLYRKGQGG